MSKKKKLLAKLIRKRVLKPPEAEIDKDTTRDIKIQAGLL